MIVWETVSYTCEAASQPQETRRKLSGPLSKHNFIWLNSAAAAGSAGPHAPNVMWKLAVQCTNIIWCFFQLLPSSEQSVVPRLACLLVRWGRLVVPRHGHGPHVSVAGQWYRQQPKRDTAHAFHKFGPITDLPCCPHLGEVGWGQWWWEHHSAAMPPPSALCLLSLGATSPHQVQLQ